jgi:raffinose/stachyose/melibiose transport system substrate-binding protein
MTKGIVKTLASAALATVALATLGGLASYAQDKVTLTYLASQGWVYDAEQALGKKFEEQTGIAIDYQIVPADQYFNLLRTKLNSGEAPDIFGGQSGVTDLKLQYNVEKNAVDLSNEPWASKLDPLVAAQSSVDGKLYGMTYWDTVGTSWVISYNKKLFADNGIAVPTDYAGLKAACETLLAKGIQPIFEPVADGWHHVLWFAELGARYEEASPGLADKLNANEATFAGNETMLSAVTQLKDLFDSGCWGTTALADTFADRTKAMASGQVAMVVAGTSFGAELEHDYPETNPEDYGVFLMPLADNQVLNLNPAGPTMFISSASPHIAEAKKYFEFLTQPENMAYFVENVPNATGLPFEGVAKKLPPDLQEFMANPKRGTVYQTAVNYVNPQWMDIGKDLTAMFTGAMAPADVLSSIDKRRAELAKAAKDPAWK